VVGTEGGKLEIWNIEQKKIVKYLDAHSDCNKGISSIIELKNPSPLIIGERGVTNPEIRYIVTSAFDKAEFKIWKLANRGQFNRPEFTYHIKIATSLPGIKQCLQTASD
jgi:hypothetical protein